MPSYESRVLALWPEGMRNEVLAVARRPSRGAAHVTTNCGRKFLPVAEYDDTVAVGNAIINACRIEQMTLNDNANANS